MCQKLRRRISSLAIDLRELGLSTEDIWQGCDCNFTIVFANQAHDDARKHQRKTMLVAVFALTLCGLTLAAIPDQSWRWPVSGLFGLLAVARTAQAVHWANLAKTKHKESKEAEDKCKAEHEAKFEACDRLAESAQAAFRERKWRITKLPDSPTYSECSVEFEFPGLADRLATWWTTHPNRLPPEARRRLFSRPDKDDLGTIQFPEARIHWENGYIILSSWGTPGFHE